MQTWQPNSQQLQRIRAFEPWLQQLMLQASIERKMWVYAESDLLDSHPVLLMLQETEFASALECYLADYYFFPLAARAIPNALYSNFSIHGSITDIARPCEQLTLHLLKHLGADYAFQLALSRLAFQLANPTSDLECEEPFWYASDQAYVKSTTKEPVTSRILKEMHGKLERAQIFLNPRPHVCMELALHFARAPEHVLAIFNLLLAEPVLIGPETRFPAIINPADKPKHAVPCALYFWVTRDASDVARALHKHQLLSLERLLALLRIELWDENYLLQDCLRDRNPDDDYLREHQAAVLDWVYAMAIKPAQFPFELRCMAKRCGSRTLTGGRFLLAAALWIEAQDWDNFDADQTTGARSVAAFLGNLRALAEQDKAADLVQSLRTFKRETLHRLLRHARSQAVLVLEALDIALAAPLYRWIQQFELQEKDSAFDREELMLLLQQSGSAGEQLLKIFTQAKIYSKSLQRINAVRGVPDKKMAGMLSRFSQEHIRNYGLYPVNDHADLVQRFEYFKSAPKLASKRFGQARSANVRDAAAAGLSFLAASAGYADEVEMEWAIEAKVEPIQAWSVSAGDYRAELKLEQLQPVLDVFKNGKALKAMPANLKSAPEFTELLNWQQRFKDQHKRYRSAIENLMICERWLSVQQLQNLRQLPVAKAMLASLLMRTQAGAIGFFNANLDALIDINGATVTLQESVQIVHAIHLLEAEVLADWQGYVVQHNIKQVIKQVFRECYVLTPAERAAEMASARFSSRSVASKILGAVLSQRGWRIDGSEFDFIASKRGPEGLRANLELPDVYQFLTQEESTKLGSLSMMRGGQQVRLAQAPAVWFSETMRDLDLIVSVGLTINLTSSEIQTARIALVRALVPQLRLHNVRLDDHFAFIAGKRASYRLHLGSAVIHVQPAGYLCVVPAESVKRADVNLPFVDDDALTSEVISKLLMLSHDEQITDASILAQINAHNKNH